MTNVLALLGYGILGFGNPTFYVSCVRIYVCSFSLMRLSITSLLLMALLVRD